MKWTSRTHTSHRFTSQVCSCRKTSCSCASHPKAGGLWRVPSASRQLGYSVKNSESHLHAIHGPVPGFNEGTRNANLLERMFDNLWPERPVMRWNWSLYGEAKLYYPAVNNQIKNRFGPGNIADNVTLRLERQTLRKLPKSGRCHLSPCAFT